MEVYDPFMASNARNVRSVKRDEGLKVIGAGFSKSGTMSLYVALGILGYRTFHMIEVFNHPEASRKWYKVLQDKLSHRLDYNKVDWSELLEGYDAGVDAPIMDVYDDLAKAYPKAKVILTVREPEPWFRSMNDVMAKPHWFNWFHIAATWWDAGKWAQIHLGRLCINSWIEKYGDGVFGPHMMQPRVDEVKANIPPERLLVFSVKEGWEPLCKFLGKPIPNEPFPRVNDGETMKEVWRTTTRRGMMKWIGTFTLAVVVLALGLMLAPSLPQTI